MCNCAALEDDRLLGEFGPRVVQYSATDGVTELRRWLAALYTHEFGRPVSVDGDIVVTHGSQQALDLLSKVLIDRGDVVVSESPAYLGAVQAIELFEPTFEVVPGDEHGMQVELLAERLAAGLRPKFVYVVPNFHNPSGATMSLERRQLLAELADRTMRLSCTIQDGHVLVGCDKGTVNIEPVKWLYKE